MHRRFNASEWLVDRHVSAGDGDRLAIRSSGQSLTFGDVHSQVVRAAGRHPSPKVNATLNQMLRGDSPLAEAAAQALGNPSHADSVPALANTLERDEPRVRMATIRALGRIGTPAARNALEIAATSHSDPATRRRAAAEVRSQARIR